MSLADLFNIPRDQHELLAFTLHNQDQHLQIVNEIATQKGISLILYSMDPLNPQDPATWLRIHQQAHADFTAALGISGVDLTDVDFNDAEQMAAFIRLHGDEHLQAANILGIA